MAPLGRDLTGRSSSSAAAMAIDRRGPSSPEHAPMPTKPAVRDRKTSLRERASSQASFRTQAASWSLLVALDNLAKLLPQPDLAPEGALEQVNFEKGQRELAKLGLLEYLMGAVVDVLIIIVPAPTNVCSLT